MSSDLKYSKESFIARHSITVPAGRDYPVNAFGRVFACTKASGPFLMSFNEEAFFDCRNGVEWALVGEDKFEKLTFRATAATTIDFYTGNFFWHQNVVVPVIKVSTTLIKAPPGIAIAAATAITLAGTGATGSGFGYRKSLIVTNLDPALDLDILDSADNLIATVLFRQANVFETSADLKLKNNNASPMNIRVMEIFYPEQT